MQASSTKSLGVSCGPALEVAEANDHFVGPSRICWEYYPPTAQRTSHRSLPGGIIRQCIRIETALPAACSCKIINARPRLASLFQIAGLV